MTATPKTDAAAKMCSEFDAWNDVTGALEKNTGWYYECRSILEDGDKKIADLQRDAERYRWLRSRPDMDIAACWLLPSANPIINDGDAAAFDAAIDAAIQRAGAVMNDAPFAVCEIEDGQRPQNVRCIECEHVWIGLYLPQPIDIAVRMMKNITCPKCGANSKHITMAP